MNTTKLYIYGRVQSVGFRPFVFKLANELGLKGYVKNKTSYVEVLLQGEENKIKSFLSNLTSNLPYPAKIEKIKSETVFLKDFASFEIKESEDSEVEILYLPAEIKVCKSCLKELFDPNDRRYLYPFINCTQCGPRFTIIKTLPYDRQNTTMDVFEMCDKCKQEYTDPHNRRFHAQPNACHECGPGLEMWKVVGEKIERVFSLTRTSSEVEKILDFVVGEILNGKIFAIKSYGGYHLVCDATNDKAVSKLRERKKREQKPLAIMCSCVEAIEKYCFVSNEEKEVLSSCEAPIVLLVRKDDIKSGVERISEKVVYNNRYFGFMLPYTPLHYLIFEWLKRNNKDIPLVMTSGNLSEEPQVFKDDEAFNKLKNIVDYFLTYNREINIRCDDSVVMVFNRELYPIRRSRGYAPEPIFVEFEFKKPTLGFGADLKNTFALAKDSYVILSHHIGDLDNLETIESYKKSIDYYLNTFKFKPEVVVCDLHPLYFSKKIAYEFAKTHALKLIELQHHYCHMLSCMLENGIFDKTIGVIFDGTGYGLDGKIWGSEFLVGEHKEFERIAYFDYLTLVGADLSIKEPYRVAATFLYQEFKDEKIVEMFWNKFLKEKLADKINFKDLFDSIKFCLENNFNISQSCGMGRFFDVVAVMCGVGIYNHYEGQLPSQLESISYKFFDEIKKLDEYYEYEIFKIDKKFVVNTKLLLKNVFNDLFFEKKDIQKVASKFHYTIVKITLELVLKIRENLNINKVVLSGGVFQNNLLLSSLWDLLKEKDFEVFIHRKVPCNDAGISFGQVLKGI
mgnify:CR=1 FL=1